MWATCGPAGGRTFLSTLSLRRATLFFVTYAIVKQISIHALLAESDGKSNKLAGLKLVFLSTLSLRRATKTNGGIYHEKSNFYPRSPCGERLLNFSLSGSSNMISIHALLAESDTNHDQGASNQQISIHALLAESDRELV